MLLHIFVDLNPLCTDATVNTYIVSVVNTVIRGKCVNMLDVYYRITVC
jgi:hypothetical protein